MISIDNIGNLKKCRIWLDELPLVENDNGEMISSVLKASGCIYENVQRVAVELFIAPRYYGLLGVEYDYKKINNLKICINKSSNSGDILSDSLALPSDNIYSGISSEYAKTILNTSIKVFKKLGNIPSGVLTFKVGQYSDYGSNQVIFSKITSIIIRLFIEKQNNNKHIKLKNIVRDELNKPLTDI